MLRFCPLKLLAFTILCEILSRTALILTLLQIPALAKYAFDKSVLCNAPVAIIALPFIVSILLFAVLRFISQKLSFKLGGEAKKNLRTHFQNKFLNTLPIQDRTQKGMPLQELSLRYIKTADLMEPWYSRFLPSAGIAVAVPCIILSIMFFIDKLTFIILLFTGLLLPVFLSLIGKEAKKKSEEQWQSFSKTRAFFLESLQGYKTVKIFKKIKEREIDLETAESEFSEKTMGVLKIAFLSALVQEWAGSISIALIAVSLALRLMNGGMDFNTAFAALLLAPEFYRPIRQFGAAFHIAINARVAWEG